MREEHSRSLVLNSDFSAHQLIDWRRAIVAAFMNQENRREGLIPIEYYKEDYIQGYGRKFPIPAVLQSPKYIKIEKTKVKFSRKNIFIRDQMTCLYCGKQFDPMELTFDHVIPRSKWDKKQGTPTRWTNIVTACYPCNNKKGNRTPKEANLHLLRFPTEPNPYNYVLGLSPWSHYPEEWTLYLPQLYQEYKNEKKRISG